jgi:hypothetical protein
MSAKEVVLEMIRDLPPEVSISEILQGIEKIALAQQRATETQVSVLRSSVAAASILNQALTAHHATN